MTTLPGSPTSDRSVVAGSEDLSAAVPIDAAQSSVDSQRGELRVQFDGDGSIHEYLKALASLTFPSSESSLVIDVDGVSRDDLELQEILDRIKAGRLRSLRFELQSDTGRSVRIDVASRSEVVTLAMPVTMEQPATQTIWLQADARFPTALPVIAFPLVADAASAEALHALVALAVKAGAFSSAVLQIGSSRTHECDGPALRSLVGCR